jgi:hypothetical protein
MWTFSSARTVRLLLAPLLSLWVAGAGCMLGCEGMVSAAAGTGTSIAEHSDHGATIVASGHACSSGETNRSHDCCKTKSAQTNSEEPEVGNTAAANPAAALISLAESSSGVMGNCPFAVSRAAIIAKTRNGDVSNSPVLGHVVLPSRSVAQTVSLSSPLRLPNRGHTYLRCCVFLI